MKCPSCGNTDLLPKFKWCPECGSSLVPRAENTPRKIEHGEQGGETSLLQQNAASTSQDADLGLNKSSTQGKDNVN